MLKNKQKRSFQSGELVNENAFYPVPHGQLRPNIIIKGDRYFIF